MILVIEWLVLLLIFAIVTFIVQYKMGRRHMETLAEKIPGPACLPLVGNLFYFLNVTHEEFIYRVATLIKQFGGVAKIWLGNRLIIAVANPDSVEVILSNPKIIDKHMLFKFFQSRSLGAFTLSGEAWRKHRRFANKMFHRDLMEWYVTIFNEQAHELEKYITQKSTTETFDISKPIMRCTLDTICRTAIGIHMDLQANTNLTFPDDLTVSSEIIIERIYKPWLQSDRIFKQTNLGKAMFDRIERIHSFTTEVIARRRRKLQNNENDSNDNKCEEPGKLYIDHMFEYAKSEGLTDHEIVLAALDIFIGGADTSAISDSYVLLFLGIYKEWQELIHKELDEVFGGVDRDSTLQDVDKLQNLEMVLKEVLRLYTAPHTVRDIKEDIVLNKCVIPAGAVVYVSSYVLHRDPRYWSHPDKFYPKHFAPENMASRPKYSYMPFSHGPRQCPGSKYGMVSMKILLSQILRKFRVECDLKYEDMKYKPSLMLELVGGYPIRLIPRTKFYYS